MARFEWRTDEGEQGGRVYFQLIARSVSLLRLLDGLMGVWLPVRGWPLLLWVVWQRLSAGLQFVSSVPIVDLLWRVATLLMLRLMIIALLEFPGGLLVIKIFVVALVSPDVAWWCTVGVLWLRVLVKSFAIIWWWLFFSSVGIAIIFIGFCGWVLFEGVFKGHRVWQYGDRHVSEHQLGLGVGWMMWDW